VNADPVRGVADPERVRREVRRLVGALLDAVNTGEIDRRSSVGGEVDLLKTLFDDMAPSSGLSTEQLVPWTREDGSPLLDHSFVGNSEARLFGYISRTDDAAEQRAAISEFAETHSVTIAAVHDENQVTPKGEYSLDMLVRGTAAAYKQALEDAWDAGGAVIVRRMGDLGKNIETVMWRMAEASDAEAWPPILTVEERLDTSSPAGSLFLLMLRRVLGRSQSRASDNLQAELTLRARYRAEYGGEEQILNDLAAGTDVPSFEVWKRWRVRRPD
jgi:hypothetical protein